MITAKVEGLRGSVYCKCGAAFSYSVGGRGCLGTAEALIGRFLADHRPELGMGHGPATRQQAARARRAQ